MEEPRIRRVLVIHPGEEPVDMHVTIEPGYIKRLIGGTPIECLESPYASFDILGHVVQSDQATTLNCTLSDYCGNAWCTLYGSFWIRGVKEYQGRPRDLTDAETAVCARLFSLEERSKPLAEQAKLIQELCPPGKTHMYTPPHSPTGTPPDPSLDESEQYPFGRWSCRFSDDTPSTSQQTYVPHCPICGSPDIEKITLAQKAFGGFMFGLFSKTAKSQFKCNNCGAKF